ncbi:alpha-2-macroglobulin family protein [Prevotellamassilia timonensis]|uniref:alpha-2-macroglobulin family protein n=1 Tax=Prevotellamassilia timonensis TaxID=1852370 RepID=UPI00307BFC26
MNKMTTLIAAFGISMGASAQSYDKLWQEAKAHVDNDLPKSAVEVVNKIQQKAVAEGNDAQLLRVMLTQRMLGAELSADSVAPCLQRMEAALAAETKPAMQPLWHVALAKCYEGTNYGQVLVIDGKTLAYDALQQRAKAHYEASLTNLDALADARVDNYLPLFTKHEGSACYHNDLLHVVLNDYCESGVIKQGNKQAWTEKIAAFYKARHANDAALLLSLRALQQRYENASVKGRIEHNAYYKALCQLTDEYAGAGSCVKIYEAMVALQANYVQDDGPYAAHNDSVLMAQAEKGISLSKKGPAANELRNFVARMTTPAVSADGLQRVCYPGSQLALAFTTRHLREVELRVTRLPKSAAELHAADNDALKALAKKAGSGACTITRLQLTGQTAPYAWRTDSVRFEVPNVPGVYYVELVGDGRVLERSTMAVSSLSAVRFATPGGKTRITMVDSQTGRPVTGVQLTAYRYDNRSHKLRQIRTYDTDAEGNVSLQTDVNRYDATLYAATTATDAASPLFNINDIRYYDTQRQWAETRVQLYTDRAIYRPGQKVAFSAVAFTREGDVHRVRPALQLKATLRNANGKVVDTLLVQTDAFGTASGEFALPQACLPGRFSISVDNRSVSGRNYFRVEAYKRPTFTATTQPVKAAYALGDSVTVEGEAKTYSGVAVADARVQYTVRRTAWFFYNDDEMAPQSGETTTDAEGRFKLPVLLESPENETDAALPRYNRYAFVVDYTVTAPNGETAQGSATLSVATCKAWLEVSAPQIIYRRQGAALPTFGIRQLNAQGENMAAKGTFVLRRGGVEVARGAFDTNEPLAISQLAQLPSAQYTLSVQTAEAAADTVTFTLLRDTDTTPVVANQPFFFYKETANDGAAARMVVGSTEKDACLFYDVVAGNRVVESRRIMLNNELLHLTFDYKEAYGDGAVLCLAMVRHGQLYEESVSVEKPKPDKRLLLHWTSFRSRLTPGQQEEWRVQITRPDGTPADAQMMACLYDASLDALVKNTWADYAVNFYRYLPSPLWQTNWTVHSLALYGVYDYKRLSVPDVQYSRWRNDLFNYERVYDLAGIRPRRMRTMTTLEVDKPMMMLAKANVATDMYDAGAAESASSNQKKEAAGGASQPLQTAAPRTNFAETAYFRPALRTNSKGEVVMAFTLPESMTQWNFAALAHDRDMNHGRLDTTVVARKDFMVEPALPRFLRQGDTTDLPVKVTNLSDKAVSATLTLTLGDAVNGQLHHKADAKVMLAPGESQVYTFPYQAKGNEGVMVCRAMAQGKGFADGEEHYLPVLTNEVQVTRTLPFSQTKAGVLTLRTDTLFNVEEASHRALSVEVSSNPTWYAVTALPALQGTDGCISANDWATRFYALAIGQQVVHDNPEIKALASGSSTAELDALAKLKAEGLTDLTPWLQQGTAEQERAEALRQMFDVELTAARMATAIDKLRTLQQADGAYSWYPGMGGNAYTTLEVAILLARVENLTSCQKGHRQLAQAMDWLKQYMVGVVREMRRVEKETGHKVLPGELAMRYLYLLTLTGDKLDDNASYLVARAALQNQEFTMYGKAVAVQVMAHYGKKAEAELLLKSLLEHTVTKDSMGRWFDTPRAEWSWRSYRIPTQCMAIEALHALGHEMAADEMRLWLLQAKRTQMWETSRASADAVYALLATGGKQQGVMPLAEKTPVYYTLYNHNKVVGFNAKSQSSMPQTVGYFKQTYTDASATGATTVRLDKRTDGLSWGSVYATFSAPASRVPTEGKGLLLTRNFEVKRAGEWVAVNGTTTLAKGDRVRQVFTITADRDYDFVTLSASRPACLQPAQPLSGYAWNMALPAYRAVHDATTDYFVEKLRKGTHQFAEDLFVDRTGQFATGVATVSCVYAPEFCGTAGEVKLITH